MCDVHSIEIREFEVVPLECVVCPAKSLNMYIHVCVYTCMYMMFNHYIYYTYTASCLPHVQ